MLTFSPDPGASKIGSGPLKLLRRDLLPLRVVGLPADKYLRTASALLSLAAFNESCAAGLGGDAGLAAGLAAL